MSQQSDQSNKSINKWRDKYLDLIDQYEQLEKSSENKQDQMRRALVIVSLLAEGQAKSIDQPLSSLREAIKPHNNGIGLDSSVQVLQDEVTRFEQQWQLQSEDILRSLNKASKNLLRLPCSAEEKQRIKKIASQSKEQLKQWSGYKEQLNAWAELLSELSLDHDGEISKPAASAGFFSRLFKRTDHSHPNSEQPDNDQPEEPVTTDVLSNELADELAITEIEPVSELPESTAERLPDVALDPKEAVADGMLNTAAEHQAASYREIEQDISDMLNRLLAQLVIPARYQRRLNTFKEKLSEKLSWEELVSLLEQVSNLIIDALGNGQEEFEQFLQGLDHRLDTIQQLISHATQGQVSRSDARGVFENILAGQVDEIRAEVDKNSELGDLGNSISQHLGLIVEAMKTFSSAESEREAELTQQLNSMQTKLHEMERLAESAQHAIEEQRKKAMHDSLTGLPNREAYQQRLKQEVERINRYGGKLSLMVCDVDLFKRINDSYGHLAGDKVLKIIARSLQRTLRDTDFIARFGGEEFVILMPETSARDAKNVAEKLRQKIESSPFNFKKEPVQITVSFGLSEFAQNESADDVFSRADKALYRAKEQGRNKVLVG